MCGIAGALSHKMSEASLAGLVQDIVDSQYRRGPDYQSIEKVDLAETKIVLGHNRLSIIDLSPTGNQPMYDGEKKYVVVFNGEIYNYLELKEELIGKGKRFFSTSDTEVILESFKEWGSEAARRFNGMFAFAILDLEEKNLWLFRDRFGIKPLYYYANEKGFYFASTGSTIAEFFGLNPNFGYLERGLRYWVYEDDTDISPYEGLKSVPAGCYLRVKLVDGKIEIVHDRYYDLNSRVEKRHLDLVGYDDHKLQQLTEQTLESAVNLRLRADVQVGMSLSGGLDSSLVAAMVKKKQNIIGYSFGHPDEKRSEGPIVEQFRKKAGIEVVYVWPKPDDFIDAFLSTIDAQDSPFPNLSLVGQYLVFNTARKDRLKVLLGGQGGDEAFMGYRKFLLFYLKSLIRKNRFDALKFSIGLVPTLMAEIPDFWEYWHSRDRFFNRKTNRQGVFNVEPEMLELSYDHDSTLRNRQIQDVTRYSLPTLLRYEDRNSMGNSIESRLPFMDYRLIELGLAMPEGMKLKHGYGKWVLRLLAREHLPREIYGARYKKGFNVNLRYWINRGIGKAVRHLLSKNRSGIQKILGKDSAGDQRYSDDNLIKNPHLLHEAIALSWAGNRYIG